MFFFLYLFFFNDTPTTVIYTLSLHDALPIFCSSPKRMTARIVRISTPIFVTGGTFMSSDTGYVHALDRKSTRLNSSHANISYAVFCLKKKKQEQNEATEAHHTVSLCIYICPI